MNGSWVIDTDLKPLDDGRSPIVVPPISARRCGASHPDHWRCMRRRGHTGRHAAILLADGQVFAVWPEPEPTA